MSYEVGTYIDLRHVNKKRVASATVAQKKSISIPAPEPQKRKLWPVGTQFIWNQITGTWDLRIPVAIA